MALQASPAVQLSQPNLRRRRQYSVKNTRQSTDIWPARLEVKDICLSPETGIMRTESVLLVVLLSIAGAQALAQNAVLPASSLDSGASFPKLPHLGCCLGYAHL